MRLWIALGGLLCVGCVGPHSSGALWAQQNLEQEMVQFRLTDAQRAQHAQATDLAVADDALAAERSRLTAALQACPTAELQPLAVSPGDRVRDGIRIQIGGDAVRSSGVAQLALADWRVRRANASGDEQWCGQARVALSRASGTPGEALGRESGTPGEVSTSTVLERLGSATVARATSEAATAASLAPVPRAIVQPTSDDQPLAALSLYAMGFADRVTAASPLPQYLAAVYGGSISNPTGMPDLAGRPPEQLVDELAPAFPQWEPDALYEALRPR
jgi:hypothetical protein